MHILFSLLRIKGLYMFRALLAHPQGWSRMEFHSNPGSNIPSDAGLAPPEDENVMLETCRGP
jgi:hypothetical protein